MKAPLISPAALGDLDAISQWLEEQSGSVDVANNFIDPLIQDCYYLAQHPHIGHSRQDVDPFLTFRFWLHGKYQIVYKDIEPIEIVRIFHGRRDLKRLMIP